MNEPLQGNFDGIGIGVSGVRVEFFQHADDGAFHELPFIGLIHVEVGNSELRQVELAQQCLLVILFLRLQGDDGKKANQ